mgnify:CR=1 FL=1
MQTETWQQLRAHLHVPWTQCSCQVCPGSRCRRESSENRVVQRTANRTRLEQAGDKHENSHIRPETGSQTWITTTGRKKRTEETKLALALRTNECSFKALKRHGNRTIRTTTIEHASENHSHFSITPSHIEQTMDSTRRVRICGIGTNGTPGALPPACAVNGVSSTWPPGWGTADLSKTALLTVAS